jgi:hypothetical protein
MCPDTKSALCSVRHYVADAARSRMAEGGRVLEGT